MGIRKVQQSFLGGEVSPAMYGRFDDQRYAQGLAQCENFIARPQGPVMTRPGTAFVRPAKYGYQKCALIPFAYSADQTMILEFGERYVRFHTNGKTLLDESGEPYEVATPYSAADVADIHWVQNMDVMTLVHPSYRPAELRRYAAGAWAYSIIDFGAPIAAPGAPKVSFNLVLGKDVEVTDAEKTRYTYRYKITAIRETDYGLQEGPAGGEGTCKGNLYLSNATVEIRWDRVEGASRYRVYKYSQGLFAYIGDTEDTFFSDDNYEADTGVTPPRYEDLFKTSGRVVSVALTNGGSNYRAGPINTIGDVATYTKPDGSTTEVRFPISLTPIEAEHLTLTVGDEANYGSGGQMATVTTTSPDVVSVTGLSITVGGQAYVTPYADIRTSVDYDAVPGTSAKTASRASSVVQPDSARTYTYEFPCTVQADTTELGHAVLADPTGKGAEISTNYTNAGGVGSIDVTASGKGYTSPTVTFTDKWLTVPQATAYMKIVEVELTNGGSGYTPGRLLSIRTTEEGDVEYNGIEGMTTFAATKLPFFIPGGRLDDEVTYEISSNVDGDEPGSGAEVELVREEGVWSDSSGSVPTNLKTGVWVRDIRIVKDGKRYSTPRIRAYFKYRGWPTDTSESTAMARFYSVEVNDSDVQVTLTDAQGQGAAVTATVDEDTGQIGSVTLVTGGDEYLNPQITFKNKGGSGAAAKASLGISKVVVTQTGGNSVTGSVSGFKTTGTKRVGSGQATPETVPFTVDRITSRVTVKIIDKGSVVGSDGNSYSGSGAQAELTIVKGEDSYEVTGFRLKSGGSRYVRPYIQIIDEIGTRNETKNWRVPLDVDPVPVTAEIVDSTGSGATVSCTRDGRKVGSITLLSEGTGYTSPRVVFHHPTGSGAAAVVQILGYDCPGAVCYHEQRRCFAGTIQRPRMIWMTRPGTESDMGYTIPSQSDNRIKFTIAMQQASRILHLVPVSNLLALTGSSEFRVATGSDLSAAAQSYIGASNVQPVVVNSTVVFAAERGGHLREMGYQWQASGYVAGDLSLRSEHLFDGNRIVSLAYSKAPDPIVWCAMADGTLLGLTYLPEQNVGGWHKHIFRGGAVESVACVTEDQEDILYCVVRRTINGSTVRYIERMTKQRISGLDEAWQVDCGGEYKGEAATQISGLDHLEGETVSILADGCVLPQQKVVEGKITLTEPAKRVVVGLPITARLKTLPVAVQMQDGSYGVGYMKNVNELWIRLKDASGLFVGPGFDDLIELKQRTVEAYGTPPTLVEREVSIVPDGKWNDSGQICIEQSLPLPLTVVSIAYDFAK